MTVAVTALPLALGLGAASGLGARAGLTSALVAGALAALLGGSNLQVSGPTGALTVVIAPVVHDFGASGALTVGLLAGAMVVGLALLRTGRHVRHVPVLVVRGFAAGSAIVIALQQIPPAVGAPVRPEATVIGFAVQAVTEATSRINWAAVAVCSAVLLVRLIGPRLYPDVPFALLAVAGATVVAQLVHLPLPRIGLVRADLPHPSLDFLALSAVPSLLPSAMAVTAVVVSEDLMTAATADVISGAEPHDGDRELFGQGVANLVAPLFGGLAAAGTVVRTASNVGAGASSRLAALAHAVTLALLAFVVAPLMAMVPLSALSGVLIATAVRLVDVRTLRALARADRGQAAVAAITAMATLVFGLVTAVAVGVAVAASLALRTMVRTARVESASLCAPGMETRGGSTRGPIAVYTVDGPLLFASAERLLRPLADSRALIVILRMARVTDVDATGIIKLRDAACSLANRGSLVLICGVRDQHRELMKALGVLNELQAAGRVFATDVEAEDYAQARLRRGGRLPQQSSGDQGWRTTLN
ncbi:SulP family inorganic anion transporter [Streptomyces sp. NPDC020096]